MATNIVLSVDGEPLTIPVHQLVIAGWTGRDTTAQEAHIQELAALGISPPAKVPTYYSCSASLVTNDTHIQVVGRTTSGEVEFVLISTDAGLLVTVGSDHTDREVEKIGVTISKQLCAKVVSRQAWRFAQLATHWEKLMLRSHAHIDGHRRIYQAGPVTTMRHPDDLIAGWLGGTQLPVGTMMFCGTLSVQGPIEHADRFEIELEDPILGQTLQHTYDIACLANEG